MANFYPSSPPPRKMSLNSSSELRVATPSASLSSFSPNPPPYAHLNLVAGSAPALAPSCPSAPSPNQLASSNDAELQQQQRLSLLKTAATYPTCFVVFHSVILIVVAVLQVVVQMVLTYDHAFAAFLAGGVFSGVFLLVATLLSLITSKDFLES